MTTLPSPVREFYDELWNRRDRSRIREILTEDVSFRGSLGVTRRGHDEFWRYVEEITGPLADYRCDCVAVVRQGARVFARMNFHGRHVGEFRGFAPTGATVHWEGAALFQIENERIADIWVLGDLAGLDALLERQSEEGRPRS